MPKTSLLSLIAAAVLCFALPAQGQELPEGNGKDLVTAHCKSCHPFSARVGAGYTAKGWRTVMRMMANHGVALPAEQAATITEYLTKNFPEKAKPVGVVRSEEHTSELQSRVDLVCRLLLEKKKKKQ